MIDAPSLSVVLAVHNGMPYLPQTVASVLGQTFRDFELVAVDDGSTDDSSRYLRTPDDARVRYHRVEHAGQAEALNHGIRAARANVIARIDADDLALPTRFERQWDWLHNHHCVLVGCQATKIDPRGIEFDPLNFPVTDQAIRFRMLFVNPFLHPGAMFRREEYFTAGGYRKEYESTEDYDLWARLAALGRLNNLPDRLMRYRIHPTSVSARRWPLQFSLASRIAGSYAQMLCPEVPARHFELLNRMLRLDEPPPRGLMPALVASYERIRQQFPADGLEPEAAAEIRYWETRLGDQCMTFARQKRFQMAQALEWIRMARRFEPKVGWNRRLFETLPSRQGLVARMRTLVSRP